MYDIRKQALVILVSLVGLNGVHAEEVNWTIDVNKSIVLCRSEHPNKGLSQEDFGKGLAVWVPKVQEYKEKGVVAGANYLREINSGGIIFVRGNKSQAGFEDAATAAAKLAADLNKIAKDNKLKAAGHCEAVNLGPSFMDEPTTSKK